MSNMSVRVRGAYDEDYDPDLYGVDFLTPTVTKQCFKDECDINNIVSRWQKSGVAGSSFSASPGEFADVADVPDYHTALNMVLDAQKRFSELPANIRDRFRNDPGEFLRFVDDPKNTDEAVSLGLAVKREATPERPQAAGGGVAELAPQGQTLSASAEKTTP